MSWARFDDQFNHHPKIAAAGPLATALYMKMVIYCAQYLTDGFVPASAVDTLINWEGVTNFRKKVASKELAKRLVEVGLLDTDSDKNLASGYWVHDYLDWNPSKEEVLKKRELEQRRLKRHRTKLNENEPNETRVKRVTKRVRNACDTHVPSPSPSPSPSLKEKKKKEEKESLAPLAVSFSGELRAEADQVDQVCQYYISKHPLRHRQTKNQTVRKKIKARLKDGFSASELCKAIDGNLASPFHRENGHTKLELICRDAAHVEQFMGYETCPPPASKQDLAFRAMLNAPLTGKGLWDDTCN